MMISHYCDQVLVSECVQDTVFDNGTAIQWDVSVYLTRRPYQLFSVADDKNTKVTVTMLSKTSLWIFRSLNICWEFLDPIKRLNSN